MEQGLKKHTLKNMSIVGGFNILSRIIRIVYQIVLARILFAADYGIVALAESILGFVDNACRFGIREAVVYFKEDEKDIISNGYGIRLTFSTVLFVIIFFLAPSIAIYFKSPELTPILRILGINILVAVFGFGGTAYLTKHLRFGIISLLQTIGALLSSGLCIVFVLNGFGYWSIIIGGMFYVSFYSIGMYFIVPGYNKTAFNFGMWKKILSFSVFIFLSGLVGFAVNNIDKIFIGKILTISALGYYQVGYIWGNRIITDFMHPISNVLFPTLTTIKEDKERFKKAYLEILTYASIVILPVTFGMFCVADNFVVTILGAKWVISITLLKLFSLFALIRAYGVINGNVFTALGKPKIQFYLSLSFFILLVTPMYYFVKVYEINGVAMNYLFAILIILIFNFYYVMKLTGVRLLNIFNAIIRPLISTLIMICGVELYEKFFPCYGKLSLLMAVIIGASLYLIGALILMKKEFSYIFGIFWNKLLKK